MRTYQGEIDIDESKLDISGKAWDDSSVALLAAKKVLQLNKTVSFWKPILERGVKFENYYEGNIFTDRQRAAYREQEAIPVEPHVAKAPIRALIGQAMKSRKSGQVVTERGSASEMADNAKEIETINVVMKDMENKTSESFKIKEALSGAFVSCYPNVLMFDKDRPSRNPNGARYKMTALPWASCVFGPPTIREADGSDIKEMFYFDYRTKADLLDNYPDMEKQIKDHFAIDNADSSMLSSIDQWEGSISADESDRLRDIMSNALDAKTSSGLVQVVMHLFPVKQKQDVWVNIFDDTGETFEIRPPDWSDERWDMWVRENAQTYAGPYERETVTLWMTVFTTSGLVLANEAHWFQENGMLPCSFWLGAVSANKPTGPMADMADDCLANAVAETEYLSDLRNGSGRLIMAREGSITNIDVLATEMNKPVGVAMVSASGGAMSEAIQEMVRRPNSDWGAYAEQIRSRIVENTRINETMMGAAAPRQSAIAKEAEISQALTVNATYIDNINRSWDYHQNLKLKLIPYFYDVSETIEVRDDKTGETMTVNVNEPQEYDAQGNVASVINDLTAHRYRYKINPVDDSPTAKMRNQEEALVTINASAGPLLQADPTGTMFATFLSSLDNPFLQETGKKMMERAEQAAQAQGAADQQAAMIEQVTKLTKAKADLLRSQKHGLMTNFRAQDLSDYPGLYELWIQLQQMFGQNADQQMAEAMQMANPQQQQMSPEMMAQ